MTVAQMGHQMDSDELALQMAYDLVEADETAARRNGVPTPSAIRATPPADRISAQDPEWYQKLTRRYWPAEGS